MKRFFIEGRTEREVVFKEELEAKNIEKTVVHAAESLLPGGAAHLLFHAAHYGTCSFPSGFNLSNRCSWRVLTEVILSPIKRGEEQKHDLDTRSLYLLKINIQRTVYQ